MIKTHTHPQRVFKWKYLCFQWHRKASFTKRYLSSLHSDTISFLMFKLCVRVYMTVSVCVTGSWCKNNFSLKAIVKNVWKLAVLGTSQLYDPSCTGCWLLVGLRNLKLTDYSFLGCKAWETLCPSAAELGQRMWTGGIGEESWHCPCPGSLSSGTKREFVSRAANTASFTGSKFIQPHRPPGIPSPQGPASHLRQGVSVRSGQLSYPMWWAFRSPVRIGNGSLLSVEKQHPSPVTPCAPCSHPHLKGTQEHNTSWDVCRLGWGKDSGWPGYCVQIARGHLLFILFPSLVSFHLVLKGLPFQSWPP